MSFCAAGTSALVIVQPDGVSMSQTTIVAQELVQPGELLILEASTTYDGDTWEIISPGGQDLDLVVRYGASVPPDPAIVGQDLPFRLNVDQSGQLYMQGQAPTFYRATPNTCFGG